MTEEEKSIFDTITSNINERFESGIKLDKAKRVWEIVLKDKITELNDANRIAEAFGFPSIAEVFVSLGYFKRIISDDGELSYRHLPDS